MKKKSLKEPRLNSWLKQLVVVGPNGWRWVEMGGSELKMAAVDQYRWWWVEKVVGLSKRVKTGGSWWIYNLKYENNIIKVSSGAT